MAKLHLILTVAANLAIIAYATQAYEEYGPEEETAKARLVNANTQLTGECLYQLEKRHPGKTVLVSIAFVLTTLGLFALHAVGSTLQSILGMTGLKSITEIHPTFTDSLESYNAVTAYTLLNATSKLYVDRCRKLTPKIVRNYKNNFGGEVGHLDFSDPIRTANFINDEVSWKIGIPNTHLISHEQIDKNMGMVFASTIYAKMKLVGKFVSKCITTIPFHVNALVTVQVPAVVGTGLVGYGTIGSLAEVFVITNKGNKNKLVFMRPYEGCMMDLLEACRDHRVFDRAIANTELRNITIIFPIVEIFGQIDYVHCFKSSGYLPFLFSPRAGGEYKDIYWNEKSAYISNMLQISGLSLAEGLEKCHSGFGRCGHTGNNIVLDTEFICHFLCHEDSPVLSVKYRGP